LPLPWPGVPHCNAWAVAAGDGIVLFDCGMHEPGSLAHLERALEMVNLKLEHVRLLVCTHAHSDHYGQAATVIERAGCELWMHPNYEHIRRSVEDPEATTARRLEVALQSGVPEKSLREWAAQRRDSGPGVAAIVAPHRELHDGMTIETDLGPWLVRETPGHAPSHVVFYQPQRRALISGDHILGRVSLYYDYGWTPDPAGEFLHSLEVVDQLDARLCLPGHGRPFSDVRGHVNAFRDGVNERIEIVRGSLDGKSKTAFEIVPELLGDRELTPMLVNWALSEILCYLRHLEVQGAVVKQEREGEPDHWSATHS
jgi:glyoxylase-like metal-dependent hydrolase (beta-lactamase superfamily II)